MHRSASLPWEDHPGQFPPALRVAAAVQGAIIATLAAIVLARARVAFPRWEQASRWAIWIAVAFSGVSAVLNLITPSSRERMIWGPVAVTMFAGSVVVALLSRRAEQSQRGIDATTA